MSNQGKFEVFGGSDGSDAVPSQLYSIFFIHYINLIIPKENLAALF